ncbi:methylamine utilization protein [Pseudoalteromonas sp. JBTF-M23]|uniref:Methylamine utilization protein n=1 Tax=Pseudoalteromonas caenipelagi TaxID=2726988 RepID=A0A849VGS6_9GAMM|nr:methylamine utilization protein [Pseudoalteromonas caenipelagi]NOU51908.1 methylamine utilization protein [Pseudoalteromonas caenipelagi]
MNKLLLLLGLLGGASHALEITITDELGKPVAGTAVWLTGKSWQASQLQQQKTYSMGQKDRAFTPHTLIVPSNSQVEFPNFDSILHHVYSFSQAKSFELKLYRDKPLAPVQFSQAGVVELGCNIHDWMLGYILVVNSGVYGLSDAKGKVSLAIESSQLGNAQLNIWHERFENLDKPESLPLTITEVSQQVQYQIKQPLLDKLEFLTDETDDYE